MTDRCQHVNVSHAKVKSTSDRMLPYPMQTTKLPSRVQAEESSESRAGKEPENREESPYTIRVYGNAKHRKFFDERKLRIDRLSGPIPDRATVYKLACH